jgi:single-stranded DNA-binding protein
MTYGNDQGDAKPSGKGLLTLYGNIAGEVEYKPPEGNVSSRIQFTVAMNFVKNGVKKPLFVRCTVWGSTDGRSDGYLRLYTDGFRKGLPITVMGALTDVGAYVDKNGVPQASIDLRVTDLLTKGTYLDTQQQAPGNYEQTQQYTSQAAQYAPPPLPAQYAAPAPAKAW